MFNFSDTNKFRRFLFTAVIAGLPIEFFVLMKVGFVRQWGLAKVLAILFISTLVSIFVINMQISNMIKEKDKKN
jgi:hypothetical protein